MHLGALSLASLWGYDEPYFSSFFQVYKQFFLLYNLNDIWLCDVISAM